MNDRIPAVDANQRTVLDLVLAYYRENRSWPSYRWLNQLLFVEHKQGSTRCSRTCRPACCSRTPTHAAAQAREPTGTFP
jgi:hypothetical protein